MSVLFIDGFDHYGTDADGRLNMLDGVWAELTSTGGVVVSPEVPGFGPRSGIASLHMNSSASQDGIARVVLPGLKTTLIVSLGVYLPSLPAFNNTSYRLIQFCDNTNTVMFTLSISTTGDVVLRSGEAGAAIVQSGSPVLTAGTWHHLEARIVISDTVGEFEVRVDETTVAIDADGLDLGTTSIAQLRFHAEGTGGGNPETDFWLDDIILKDALGGVNDGFSGDMRVATLVPNLDDTVPWTPRYRKKLSTGVLDVRATNSAVSAADHADFEFGTGDYTVEGFVRFYAASAVTRQIIGKWQTASDQREWTLELTGSGDANPNLLRLLVSTDGAAETEIHAWPWQPDLYRYYHVAVSRDTAENYLFIDGVIQGVPRADSNDYFGGSAALAIGARMSSASAVVATTGVNGLMDEVRITNGVGRYTGNFTPPAAPFGRDVGGDPDFASVVLLAGFDGGTIADESDSAHALTARNSAVSMTPDDGNAAYETINQLTPRDDTHIEAALLPATGILTPSDNPADDETVTIGATVYTFKDTIGSAYDVHIGATLADTLDNLVAAINDSGGEGTDYGTGTDPHPSVSAERLPDPQIRVTAITAGAAGNSIASTETIDGVWENGATLAGGQDIPAASLFGLSRLPPDTTVIRAVAVISRAYKTDAGSAKTELTFIGPSDGEHVGAERTLTVDPTYYTDIFQTDPDTAGPITPATLLGARIKIDRTE